jgi:ATP-dependent DNA ligase
MESMAPGDQSVDVREIAASLRPQPFGHGDPGRVADPLIEPLWTGVRALAAIDSDGVALANDVGDPIEDLQAVAKALAEAALADGLILDGFLTKLAARDGSGVFVALDILPSASQMVSRPLIGIRPTRAEDALKAIEDDREARAFGPDDTVRFVAIDLLWLEGESLLDVPLLERRRLLESVVIESDLVRRGVFVRPPIDAWLGSWRSLGFAGLSYKAANSRYRPGVPTTDWITIPMPRR